MNRTDVPAPAPAAHEDGPLRTPTMMRKRSLEIAGHRTSISLEDAFWESLREIAAARGLSLAGLVAQVDAAREGANLSSAIRVFVLETMRARGAAPDAARTP